MYSIMYNIYDHDFPFCIESVVNYFVGFSHSEVRIIRGSSDGGNFFDANSDTEQSS